MNKWRIFLRSGITDIEATSYDLTTDSNQLCFYDEKVKNPVAIIKWSEIIGFSLVADTATESPKE